MSNDDQAPATHQYADHEPAGGAPQRTYSDVLADAAAVLSEAARLRRPVRLADSQSMPAAVAGDRIDWAEFVALALAGAAANLGGIEQILAGRPGSWEAAKVGDLLLSTLGDGHDREALMRHRTEPVRVVIDAEKILNDLIDHVGLYDESSERIDAEASTVEEQQPTLGAGLFWKYRPTDGRLVPVDDAAPPFDEQRWRDDMAAHGASAQLTDELLAEALRPDSITAAVLVSRDEAARARLAELERQRAEHEAPFLKQMEDLERQREREISEYATQLRAGVEELAADLWPHLALEMHVLDTEDGAIAETVTPDPIGDALLQAAIELTALHESGLRPGDYPTDGRPLEDHEREAGRLPHTRLPDSAPSGGPGAAAGADDDGPGGEL